MNPLFDKPFTFDRVIRIVFGILVISGIIYLIALLRNALLPFLIAWLLAYMMQPFVKFFQYKLCFKSRILSIMAVLVTLGLLITLLVVMVIPSIAAEADKTLELIRTHDPGEGHVPLIPHSWMEYLESNVNFAQIMELLSSGEADCAPVMVYLIEHFLNPFQYHDRVRDLALLYFHPFGL